MRLAVAALAVGVGAFAQSLSGIGFALVCGPFLVVLLGPRDGVRTAVALSILVNLVVLARDRRAVRWRPAALLFVPAALATPVAAALLRHVDHTGAALAAGLATIAGTALLAMGRSWRRAAGRAGAVAAGVASAAMNSAAAIGGPAAALYAENAGWPPTETRATLQAYFLALNVTTLAAIGVAPVAPALPVALVVGALGGGVVSRRLAGAGARAVTLALAVAGGIAVVVRALATG